MEKSDYTGPDLRHLEVLANMARLGRSTIVLATGVWDILHSGHIRYLHDAAKLGDTLFVGVDSDDLVRRTKGPNRPILPENERWEAVNSLKDVDVAFVFGSLAPVINVIKPDFLVVSPTTKDASSDLGDRYELAQRNNVQIVSVPSRSGTHTSGIVDSILSRFGSR